MILPEHILNSKENLEDFLKTQGISEDATTILKDEGVDGHAFIMLTENDLKELKIKIGPRKKILNLIQDCSMMNIKEVVHIPNNVETNVNNITNNDKENVFIIPSIQSNSFTECQNMSISVDDNNADNNVDNNGNNNNVHNIVDNTNNNNEQSENFNILNVRSWVEDNDKHSKRNPSLTTILDSGIIKPVDRQELIRICCAGLAKYNDDNLYPSRKLKTELAREIVAQFPKLRSTVSENGYEHFYDEKTNQGFIEFRFKTMRKLLSPSKKRRATSNLCKKKKSLLQNIETQRECLESSLFQLKVADLALKMPNETNKSIIFQLSDETRHNRQMQVRHSDEVLTLSDILDIYPRFKDYNGELIHREFIAEFPGNDNFLAQFVTVYVPRILQYCAFNASNLLEQVSDIEDNLKALIVLPYLLPSPNYMKRKINDKNGTQTNKRQKFTKQSTFLSTIPHESLLVYKKAQDDLFPQNKQSSNKKNVQPYLICSTPTNERKGIFYIKADNHLIEIGNNGLQAFDILLKLHYCFDIEFSTDLINFYDFITGCVLKLTKPKAYCIAFDTTLKNLMPIIILPEQSDTYKEDI